MASIQTKGEGATWPSNMYRAQLKVVCPFPLNNLRINLKQCLRFSELAEVLGVRVNMEEEEGKKKD